MERHEVLEMMAALKLAGMRDAFDEVLADGLKRQHPMQRIIGELLKAEIADKQARSIKYQMSGAKLPLAKCPSSKQMGLLSVFHKGGSGSSLFDVKPLGDDGSSGGFGWSVF